MALKRQFDINDNFHNFRSAIYTIRQTVEEEMSRSKASDRKKVEASLSLDLYNVNNSITHIVGEIENFNNAHINHPDILREGANKLLSLIESTREIIENGEFNEVEERVELLDCMESIIYKQFKEVLEPVRKTKLRLNAPKNVIYNLIQQLKKHTILDSNAFLPQSYMEIAKFLIDNVEGFEDVNADQLSKELARQSQPIKKKHFIVTTKG